VNGLLLCSALMALFRERERVNKLTPAEKKVEDDARQQRLMDSIQVKNDEINHEKDLESGKADGSLFDPNPFD